MGDVTTDTAPLTNFRIVGIRENWIGINPGTEAARMVPGGSCWHCGTGIANEVVIKDTATGEQHTIGTTCAERVGLSKAELKAMLAEKYAVERHERSAAEVRRRKAAAEERELREAAAFGPHGTESRYASGCWCELCVKVAPHGTEDRFFAGKCRCLNCIEWALTQKDQFEVWPRDVLVDVDTGEQIPAKLVNTTYGTRWCIRDGAAWAGWRPARRSTLAKRGLTEAEIPVLVQHCGRGRDRWTKDVCPLASPIADRWGEPIARAS